MPGVRPSIRIRVVTLASGVHGPEALLCPLNSAAMNMCHLQEVASGDEPSTAGESASSHDVGSDGCADQGTYTA